MRCGWVLGLAVAGWSLSASAAETAIERLARIGDAARTTNYQGVLIYQTRNRLETLKVVHRYEDGNEVEHVQALTGDPREIIKRRDEVICLLPRDRKVTLQLPTPKGLFPAMSPERLAQLTRYYAFEDVGEARIAGRPCRGIRITPRDRFRYGYEIWTDQATAVPVKVNLQALDGSVMEQLMFTQIEFPASIPDSALEPELDPKQFRRVTHVVREAPTDALAADAGDTRFARLPPGYQVTMREVRPSADGQGLVEHLVLSDGLSAISVFTAHRRIAAQTLQGASQIGPISAFGRVVGRVHVTVVGEVPSEAVRLVGESAQPVLAAPDDAAVSVTTSTH